MKSVFLLLLLLLPTTAPAQEVFVVNLSARDGTSAKGTGQGTLTIDRFETEVEFLITVEGLSSPELGAHIHRPDGVIAYALPLGETKSGVWQGVGFLDLFLLRSEQMFVLVHTDVHPSGELRGDVKARTVPVEVGSFGAIKALYGDRGQP